MCCSNQWVLGRFVVMAEDITKNRGLWLRVATIASAVWVGGTLFYSASRKSWEYHSFRFWDSYSGPQAAFWFALVGAGFIFVAAWCIPWISNSGRPRPFWKRLGIIGATGWLAVYWLRSIYAGHLSDTEVLAAAIGAALTYIVLAAVPWIVTGTVSTEHVVSSGPNENGRQTSDRIARTNRRT
jgi:hypothetical protein